MADIAIDHRQILVLAAFVEAEPEAEAVGQRDLLLDGLAGIDRGRALVLDHLARQQMPAIRGCIEHDILRPPLDATIERRFQRLVRRVLPVEGEVVAEDDGGVRVGLEQSHQHRQALDVLAVDLDQLEGEGAFRQPLVGVGVHRLDQ